ncbi:hypothetical protein DWB78_00565 [Halopelagius longus]|uniref:Uncharacterized protein n=1 Tax=Halopelagius longus TaxID=1236180 RepID=A0A370II06_9EURY|nr:hypothetical protein DWB78_00565 [Halopelagius longus]
MIALDGTPTVEQWRLLLGETLQWSQIMSNEEKQSYLSNVLNLDIIQTVEPTVAKPYSGGGGVTVRQDLTLIEAISNREQCKPALITSQKALQKYKREGLSKFVGESAYYGGIKGSNRFAKTRVGIVAGSPHYGDSHMEMWSALAGKSASREDDSRGMDADYGPFGNKILHGMREQEVLQAVMRFGRDGEGATVYVHTAALPNWVKRSEPIPDVKKWSSGMREIIEAIQNHTEETWVGHDIADEVSISYQQVMVNLRSLEDLGYIVSEKSGKTKIWSTKSLDSVGDFGHVQFSSFSGS